MFVLKLKLHPADLAAIKAELTRTVPTIKSTHRCEALARGLGARTYSSLLRQVEKAPGDEVVADGIAFTRYLASKNFETSAVPFYQAVARCALRAVAERTPLLTYWGIGTGEPQRKPDGRWEDHRDINAAFRRQREALVEADIESFLACLALLSNISKTRTVRPAAGSYRLKHIAEHFVCHYPEGGDLGPRYVSNGVFIAAAVHAGFAWKGYRLPSGYESLNVSFNMGKQQLEDLDCEIRPDSGAAENRRWRQQMSRRPYRFPAALLSTANESVLGSGPVSRDGWSSALDG